MIRVSDMAMLRFLERTHSLDVEAMRTAIGDSLTRAASAAAQLGVSTYAVRLDGISFVVRNATVTTVIAGASEGGRFRALAPREQ